MVSDMDPSDSAECSGVKRKYVVLTIMLKVEILQKLNKGKSVRNMRDC